MNFLEQKSRFNIGDVRYPPGGHLGPRVQPNLQMVYIHKGAVRIRVDGKPVRLGAGQMIVLLPGHHEQFTFSKTEVTHHGWCEVRRPILSTHELAVLASLHRLVFESPVEVAHLAPIALALRFDQRWAAAQELTSLCAALLAAALRAAGVSLQQMPEPESGTLPPALRRLLSEVHQNYASLEDGRSLATTADMSQQHLSRLFRRYLGTTPMEYLWRVRTEHAIELIRATGLSLHEIAYQCGFSNQFHLSRRVKAASGNSPTELRRVGTSQAGDASGALSSPE